MNPSSLGLKYKHIDRDAFDALHRQWKATGSLAARNRMIEMAYEYVRAVAFGVVKHLSIVVDVEDLVSYGVLGVIDALKSYDPDRGVRFDSFAGLRIRGAMFDNLRLIDPTPRQMRRHFKVIEESAESLRQQHACEPTPEEIQESTGANRHLLPGGKIAMATMTPLSLSTPIDKSRINRQATLADELVSPDATPPEQQVSVDEVITFTLETYGLRAALLLRLRFLEGKTLSECAAILGPHSESRMSQKQRQLLSALRQHFGVAGLSPMLMTLQRKPKTQEAVAA